MAILRQMDRAQCSKVVRTRINQKIKYSVYMSVLYFAQPEVNIHFVAVYNKLN